MHNWYKTAQATPQAMPTMNVPAPTPGSPNATKQQQSPEEAEAELKEQVRNRIVTNVLPPLVNQLGQGIKRATDTAMSTLTNNLRAYNIDVSRMDTRGFFAMIVDMVNVIFSTKGSLPTVDQLKNTPAVRALIDAIVQVYTPSEAEKGQARINTWQQRNQQQSRGVV